MFQQLSALVIDPRIVQTTKDTMDTHGYGMSSTSLICGYQNIHKKIGKALA